MYPSVSVNEVPMSTATTAPAPTAPPNAGPSVIAATATANPNVIRISTARWSAGLCDCFTDINSCCLTFWCPCIAFGRIAEIVDKGSTSCGVSGTLYSLICCFTCCSCMYSCFYRSKLRGQYFLSEAPCADCCVHCCCEECALCQEYRELQNRGFDMSIGWHGNMERQKRIAAMATAPVIAGAMTR